MRNFQKKKIFRKNFTKKKFFQKKNFIIYLILYFLIIQNANAILMQMAILNISKRQK